MNKTKVFLAAATLASVALFGCGQSVKDGDPVDAETAKIFKEKIEEQIKYENGYSQVKIISEIKCSYYQNENFAKCNYQTEEKDAAGLYKNNRENGFKKEDGIWKRK